MIKYLKQIVDKQKKGLPAGLLSICSANPFVVQAAINQAKDQHKIIAIESTSEQVNQFGGYTGMTPRQFVLMVEKIAIKTNFPVDNIILGGDHLGPNPWRKEPTDTAMQKARQLIHDYVLAGYKKIHVDTSMACIDDKVSDNHVLPPDICAQRAADLCQIAESKSYHSKNNHIQPTYIIGSDVPSPGGMDQNTHPLSVSTVRNIKDTIDISHAHFLKLELESAWQRTCGIVVQSGAEFGPETVLEYNRNKTKLMVDFIKTNSQFVYEAHSTDYQSLKALCEMVEDQFAILKVGPALTFALREALFALTLIEQEWLKDKPHIQLSNLKQVVKDTMQNDPTHWSSYYQGDPVHCRYLENYAYSDRIRYYWPYPSVHKAIQTLLENLSSQDIPFPLISQYLPKQLEPVLDKKIKPNPIDLIYNKIQEVTLKYLTACE